MVHFIKIESTGNDFILIKNLDKKITLSAGEIKKLCHRQLGIGADGLILVEPPPKESNYQFTMRYFNKDGIEVEMCGNGARAVTLFVAKYTNLSLVNGSISFKTYESDCHATIRDSKSNEAIVAIEMPPIKDVKLLTPTKPWSEGRFLYCHTGVPHLVLEHPNVKSADIYTLGKAYRNDPVFPSGTNVNFFYFNGVNEAIVRTYERGVENETLSCGTGAVAVAYTIREIFQVSTPITIHYPGGYLHVELGSERPRLIGPTRIVFEGNIP